MIKVIALSAKWCGKCKDAKKILSQYDSIEWLDVDNDYKAEKLVEQFNVEHLPFFVIGDENSLNVTTSRSYKQVEKLFEKI